MEIVPTSQVTEPVFSTAQEDAASFSADFNTFLNLLTAQLQNQDPLEPMETSEFTNQLVQYSSVEQAIISNQKLEDITGLLGGTEEGNDISPLAFNYLGNTADYETNKIAYAGEEVEFQYLNDQAYATSTAQILDRSGNVIKVIEGAKEQGLHTLKWDGTNDEGVQQPHGQYTMKVFGASGFTEADVQNATQLATMFSGKVTKVAQQEDTTVLTVNGVDIPASSVIAVRETTAPDEELTN